MHGGPDPGYDPGMTPADTTWDGDVAVTSSEGLVAVLGSQHEELRQQLSRVTELHGQAREDEFLQVRRRLATHVALETELMTPRLAGEAAAESAEVEDHVVLAEEHRTTDPAFEDALSRAATRFEQHAERQEHGSFLQLQGRLTEAEQAMVDAALSLWHGEGEAYLGNDYRAMVASARAQLRDAPEPGRTPPV
jgi:hypothetical protein